MARGDFLAEQAADRNRRYSRNRFTHPAKSAQALQQSGAGITFNRMMDLQRQDDPDLGALKDARRSWNRNFKSTPAGMRVAGVSTPQGAMDRFRTGTEAFRQANKPAYNRMYPASGMAMDYPEKGGILGMTAKNFLKNIFPGGGVDSLINAGDKERYIAETFGPHLEEVPYGGPPPFSDAYEGPRPHAPYEDDYADDPTELGEPTGSTLADVLSEDDFDDPYDVRTPEGAEEYDALRLEEDYPEPPTGDMSQMDWRTYMQILKRLGQESADIYAQNANRGGIMGVI